MKNLDCRRCRNWHHAMRATHKTAAKLQGRRPHGINIKSMKTDGRAHDVHNGIGSANFVKVHVFQSLAMHLGFCLGYAAKNTQARLFDRVCQCALRDDSRDAGQIPVQQVTALRGAVAMHMGRCSSMRMFMLVDVSVFMPVLMVVVMHVAVPVLLTVQVHMNLHPLNPAAFFWLTLERKLVIYGELCQFCLQVIGADPKINRGGQIHIAADSGKTIVIQYLHKAPARNVHLKKEGQTAAARAQYRYFARNRE